MAAALREERLERAGVRRLEAREGRRVLDAVMQWDGAQAVAVAIRAPKTEGVGEWKRLRDELPEHERPVAIAKWLRAKVAEVLGTAAGKLDERQPLSAAGLDSLMALELRNWLVDRTSLTLPATLLFDYPTLEKLSAHLVAHLAGGAQTKRRADKKEIVREPIAIIGMGCRFPADADTPERFWKLLRNGVDATREVPRDRWDIDAFWDPDPDAPGKMCIRRGGFVDGIAEFDPQFFGISPREAAAMDPQQRLLLEVSWHAVEDAGIAHGRLWGTRTAVYVGISTDDYTAVLTKASETVALDAYVGVGTAASVASGRIAYTFNLQGPCASIDTACSSSLVAIHEACQSLQMHEADLALAGGVNAMLAPGVTVNFSQARMLAPDGRCKTFDASADGYVRGEGCGMVVLKRLGDALSDGDRIWAVIAGSGMNQDGRSAGLTAPNGPSQREVMEQALAAAAIDPATVGYLEAHGTGTRLGDPIEMNAALAVYGGPRALPLRIGSVKTNIGHLEAAAGVSQIMKAVLAVWYGEVPPHLHLRNLNPLIALEGHNVSIPCQVEPFPSAGLRRAAVSSFGFSGTNVHLVIEQAPAPPAESLSEEPWILAISARTPAALKDLGRRHAAALRVLDAASFADYCWSAATLRSTFPERVAVVAANAQEAARLLEQWIEGLGDSAIVEGTHTGADGALECGFVLQLDGLSPDGEREAPVESLRTHAQLWISYGVQPVVATGDDAGRAAVALLATAGRPVAWGGAAAFMFEPARLARRPDQALLLAKLWTAGAPVDWMQWYGGRGRHVDLPLYPMQRRRYYIDPAPVDRRPVAPADIVPLPGRKLRLAGTSKVWEIDLAGIPWLSDHRVRREPVLPAAAFLAAAIDAGEDTLGVAVEAREFRFLQPLRIQAQPILQTSLVARDRGFAVEFSAAAASSGDWALYASGGIVASPGDPAECEGVDRVRRRCRQSIDPDAYYSGLASLGLEYGPSFRWIRELHLGDGESLARLQRPADARTAAGRVDPRLLDACLQCAGAACAAHDGKTYLPATLGSFRWLATTDACWVHVRAREQSPGWSVTIRVYAETGGLTGQLEDLRVHPADLVDPCDSWLYRVSWIEAARPDGSEGAPFLPAPLDVARDLQSLRRTIPQDPHLARYQAFIADQACLCQAYAREAVARIGRDALARHAMAMSRILALAGDAQGPGSEVLLARLREGYPEFAAELAFLERCGTRVADVVTGRADAVEVLFEDSAAADFYENSPGVQALNRTVEGALKVLAAECPPNRKLRVLEAGAGTGATTAAALRALQGHAFEYCFTDVSPAFLAAGRTRFQGAEIEFRLLDIERDPHEQGFRDRAFDLVLAANVVHATRSVGESIRSLGRLVVPGGLLLLVEGTRPVPLLDLTFGLTDGWWRFTDRDLRRDYPLLPYPAWLGVLHSAGFANTECLNGTGEESQVVMLSHKPATAAAPASIAQGRTLLLGNALAGIAHALTSAGQECVLASSPLEVASGSWDRVIEGRTLDDPEPCRPALETAQWLAARGSSPRLWLLTRNSQPVLGGAEIAASGGVQATVWGFGRALAMEYPAWNPTLLDLDSADDAGSIVRELLAPDDRERQLAFRHGKRYVARLTALRAEPGAPVFDASRSYLITGGTGGLGLALAAWLAARGARHLVLMARHAPPVLATGMEFMSGDVSDRAALVSVLARIQAGGRPLDGIFHLAGHLADSAIPHQSWARFQEVFAGKVAGVQHLEELTAGMPLRYFVLFSSAAAVLAPPAQSNHAAANAFLDAAASRLRSQGRPAVSIGWSAWSGLGAAAKLGADARFERFGAGSIDPRNGFRLLERLLAASPAHVVAMPMDWIAYRRNFPSREWPRFLDLVHPSTGETSSDAAADRMAIEWRSLPLTERRSKLREAVRAQARRIMNLSPDQRLDDRQPLSEAGLDSLTALELSRSLAALTGLPVAATDLFRYPSIVALADWLCGGMEAEVEPVPETSEVEPNHLEGLDAHQVDAVLEEELHRIGQLLGAGHV